MPNEVIPFPRARGATVVSKSSPADALEPLLDAARRKIEQLLPMNTRERVQVTLILEGVLDAVEKWEWSPPDGGAAA